ncbi:acyl-CoA dehydrogenase family protein [Nocardioides marmotae]|uniref:acyl-CoA dehydrogenase family protein n=1 Tax=Nocardioides marmotae TaxID=2663857 RepID=UPI0012B5FDCB|nr:acyl-CoA dehydrogenase family protein [Nocardioides marmotae]MBC9734447.1 acyl-CoA dehydrogenase family protein [Nocardioides marmotae]MTB85547.1 hypothetical protein [Nocardioides marmotae]
MSINTDLTPPTADLAGVTHEVLVQRARDLTELVRSQADESEERGYYSEQLHEEFLAAGFYHILTPKKYGGLELGLDTFAEVMVEIGRGDPSTAWCLGLGLGHTLTLASYWPEQAQAELFGNSRGYFRAPHRLVPEGTAEKVDGGWVVEGTWHYNSGIQYSSHFKGTARTVVDGKPAQIVVVVPTEQVEILPNWGGDQILGMRASGSNSVRVDKVLIPEHWAVNMDWRVGDRTDIAPGAALHGNAMYCGKIRTPFMVELASTVVGAAQAAIDEYGSMLRIKKTPPPRSLPRFQDTNHQRDFGLALSLADSSKHLLLAAARGYMDGVARWGAGIEEFDDLADSRLRAVTIEAGKLACDAVESIWRTGGSSQAAKGDRMQRYFRDVSMWRQHMGTQYMNQAPGLAQAYFGILESSTAQGLAHQAARAAAQPGGGTA